MLTIRATLASYYCCRIRRCFCENVSVTLSPFCPTFHLVWEKGLTQTMDDSYLCEPLLEEIQLPVILFAKGIESRKTGKCNFTLNFSNNPPIQSFRNLV